MTKSTEERQAAIRASVWTMILLTLGISVFLVAEGVADQHSMAVRLGTLGAVLTALAAATMHITCKIEQGALNYTRGFREGFNEARTINGVLPFPSPEREPSRR